MEDNKIDEILNGLKEAIILKNKNKILSIFLTKLDKNELREFLLSNLAYVLERHELNKTAIVAGKDYKFDGEINFGQEKIQLSEVAADKLLKLFLRERNLANGKLAVTTTASLLTIGSVTTLLAGNFIGVPAFVESLAANTMLSMFAVHSAMQSKDILKSSTNMIINEIRESRINGCKDFETDDFKELAQKFTLALEPQFQYAYDKTVKIVVEARQQLTPSVSTQRG